MSLCLRMTESQPFPARTPCQWARQGPPHPCRRFWRRRNGPIGPTPDVRQRWTEPFRGRSGPRPDAPAGRRRERSQAGRSAANFDVMGAGDWKGKRFNEIVPSDQIEQIGRLSEEGFARDVGASGEKAAYYALLAHPLD